MVKIFYLRINNIVFTNKNIKVRNNKLKRVNNKNSQKMDYLLAKASHPCAFK